jgi:signal transduction histidine kinase
MRLVVILLVLVVLPTALLSVLAGRSIQAREVILHRRLEQAAIQQINGAREAFGALLQSDASRVSRTFRETVLSGFDAAHIERAVRSLQGESAFVEQPFLFMQPWGFVFPNVPEPSLDASESAHVLLRKDLVELLSKSPRTPDSKLSLHRGGRVYYFSPLPGYSELHAGFEVDVAAVMARLDEIAFVHSTADIGLRMYIVEGGLRSGLALSDQVLVSDSFNAIPERSGRLRGADEGGAEALASGTLQPPFSHITLAAFLVHEDDLRHAEALEARLIGWGILLLAVVITASSAILIWNAVRQAAVTRQRTEFVIGMSHDLRTPVASMRLLADSLSAGRVEDPEKQRRFLRTIASECERLGDMIERILFFFRQEQRAMSYTMSCFDVGEMVSRTVAAYRDRQHGKVSIGLNLCAVPTTVRGDAEALAKVVTNLLDNAVKYGLDQETAGAQMGVPVEAPDGFSVEGCAPVDIEVRVHREQRRGHGWVVVSVADHGAGIPARAQGRIFERFYRHDNEVHRHVGGIGLGLSLCADIARAHRGRMVVQSEEGEGAVFALWLRHRTGKG